jgi:hypothetical protein
MFYFALVPNDARKNPNCLSSQVFHAIVFHAHGSQSSLLHQEGSLAAPKSSQDRRARCTRKIMDCYCPSRPLANLVVLVDLPTLVAKGNFIVIKKYIFK